MQHLYKDFYINRKQILGIGSFGKVYIGEWRRTDGTIKIAIKQIEDTNQSYQEQVAHLSKLSQLQHDNIVKLYGVTPEPIQVKLKINKSQQFFVRHFRYIFMELCQNNLRTILCNLQNGIPQLLVLQYIGQIINGMSYINAKNILHRDLKPQNILISFNNKIKIADFGLGRTLIKSDILTTNRGTKVYAAPQVYLQKENYGKNCDVWSCGMILYEMLFGKRLNQMIQTQMFWQKMKNGQQLTQFKINFLKLHPRWQYLVDIMLVYDRHKRKQFSDLWQIYKTIYPVMRFEITSKKKYQYKDDLMHMLEKYLTFKRQKFQILDKIFIKHFGIKTLIIKDQRQKLLCISYFLILCRYFVQIKKLFLKNENYFYLPGSQTNVIRNRKDYERIILIDVHRNQYKKKLKQYQTLMYHFCQKLQKSKYLIQDKRQIDQTINNFIENIKLGLFDDQESYNKLLQEIFVTQFLTIQQSKLNNTTTKYLQNYLYLLISVNLDRLLHDEDYLLENNKILQRINQIFTQNNRQKLLRNVRYMHRILHMQDQTTFIQKVYNFLLPFVPL